MLSLCLSIIIPQKMDFWWKPCLILCVFGFLKQIQPSSPYNFSFYTGPWKNFTEAQITQEVYPVYSYATLILLVLIFLITDLCRYKPLLVLMGCCGVTAWAMYIWTSSVLSYQVIMVIAGLFSACEVAYYTYIYAKVDKEHFEKVTSYTRAAILAGRTVSYALSQFLVSFKLMNFLELNYITFGAMLAAAAWSIMIPSVERSIYFHRKSEGKEEFSFMENSKAAFALMKSHFIKSFSNTRVLKWSFCYAALTAVSMMVQMYIQAIWSLILGGSSHAEYNALVEGCLMFFSFLASIGAGYFKINWSIKGEFLVCVIAILQGTLVVWISQTDTVWVAYVCLVLYGTLYNFIIAIASAEIAKDLPRDSYGLIFGVNTFLSVCLQTILTALFVNKSGLGYIVNDVKLQYLIYGVYHFPIALIFLILAVIALFTYEKEKIVVKI